MACFSLDKVITRRIGEALKCSYNHGLLLDPVTDECGHTVCQECFDKQWQKNKKCPVSKKAISNKLKSAKEVADKLNKIKVSCDGGADDCEWEGHLEELQTHLKNCRAENSGKKVTNKKIKGNDNKAVAPEKAKGVKGKKASKKDLSDLSESSESSGSDSEEPKKPAKKGAKTKKVIKEESDKSEDSDKGEHDNGNNHKAEQKHAAPKGKQPAPNANKNDKPQKDNSKKPKVEAGMQMECNYCKMSYQVEDQEYHLDVICKSSLHQCPFLDAGCTFKGTWEELDNHTDIDYKRHMQLLEYHMLQFRDYESLIKKLLENIKEKEKGLHKDTTKEIADLEQIDLPLVQSKFDTKFAHPTINFEDDYNLVSSPDNDYQLVFFRSHFSPNHRVVIHFEDLAQSTEIGFGLAEKEHFFDNDIRKYREEDAQHFLLFMTQESHLSYEAAMTFKRKSDYELSYNKETKQLNIVECNFEVDHILENDFKFEGSFTKWQPVLVIKGGCKIQLTSFCDFNRA